jgi:hypothetical protein
VHTVLISASPTKWLDAEIAPLAWSVTRLDTRNRDSLNEEIGHYERGERWGEDPLSYKSELTINEYLLSFQSKYY